MTPAPLYEPRHFEITSAVSTPPSLRREGGVVLSSQVSGRQTHVEVIEHLVHHLHPVAHPLELHVQVDELGLVLPPLVAVGRRQGQQLSCNDLRI